MPGSAYPLAEAPSSRGAVHPCDRVVPEVGRAHARGQLADHERACRVPRGDKRCVPPRRALDHLCVSACVACVALAFAHACAHACASRAHAARAWRFRSITACCTARGIDRSTWKRIVGRSAGLPSRQRGTTCRSTRAPSGAVKSCFGMPFMPDEGWNARGTKRAASSFGRRRKPWRSTSESASAVGERRGPLPLLRCLDTNESRERIWRASSEPVLAPHAHARARARTRTLGATALSPPSSKGAPWRAAVAAAAVAAAEGATRAVSVGKEISRSGGSLWRKFREEVSGGGFGRKF